MKDEFYRPVNIEFNVTHDGSNMPVTLGDFKTAEDASKFIGGNLTAINRQLTAARYMDTVEKVNLRKKYSDLLEDILPAFATALSAAEMELTAAKKKQKEAEEAYNVTVTNAKNMAAEVKRGLKDMELDEKYTYRVPYKAGITFLLTLISSLSLQPLRIYQTLKKATFGM